MQIGPKDVAWNFAATFMRIASGVIVLPLTLRMLPSQEVGLWNIFLTIGSLAALLDFGFSNAFARNITYVFSGVKELKPEGYVSVDQNDKTVHYGLLRSVIAAMRFYYGMLAGLFLLIFVAVSPFYLSTILQKYTGDIEQVWIAWFTFGCLVAYQLYTYYYGALLTGRGMVKKSLQIVVIAQSVRIVLTVIFLLCGMGLLSLVAGLLIGDILNRTLCYLAFYDRDIKQAIRNSLAVPVREILKIMTPNAIKIGLTTLGGFFVNKIVILIAPLYLSLSDIASYGTTKQMIDLIVSLGGIWFGTYYPKVTLYRVSDDVDGVKRLYIKGKLCLIGVFFVCGAGLILLGPPVLVWIHSKTHLLPEAMMLVFLIVAFLEANHGMSAGLLLTKNEVPFVKASIFSGIAVVILLFISLKFTSIGIWGMILAPGIAQAVYQNWKWPMQVINELQLKFSDYTRILWSSLKETKII